jgi:hypothetical protein
MTKSIRRILLLVTLASILAPASALADPDELMPCRFVIVRSMGPSFTRFSCKGTFALPSAGAAPTGGAASVSVNTVPPGNSQFGGTSLSSDRCTGLGNPAGSRGYVCKAPVSEPAFGVLVIRPTVVKGVVRYDVPAFHYGTTHPYPATSDVAIRVATYGPGAIESKRYCARFGSANTFLNNAKVYRATNAPAPAACSASGAFLDGTVGVR